jgi:uncharacterized protein (DUF1501 family)
MFRIDGGRAPRYCDGISRRSFLQVGVAGMASVGLAGVARAVRGGDPGAVPKKDTSVILLWLDGGAGHMDTYDMKPEAPAEYRGIWHPIRTNVPGVEITELFPLQAKIADKFSIVRSLHHDDGDHFGGAHRMLTGRGGASGNDQDGKYPGVNCIAAKLCGARNPGMPAQVALPHAMTVGLRPGYFGGNYLGRQYDPFEPGGDPNAEKYQVENLALAPGMTVERLDDRRQLRAHLDRIRRDADASGAMDTMDHFDRAAFDLITGPAARKAFDIGGEDPRVREMYGRNDWGQNTLLARRLVEAGATFVTVCMAGWDHHWDLEKGMNAYLPKLDRVIHGLFTDLSQRGLLDKVLVLCCGEFGRTPRMNDGGNGGAPRSMGTPGRDHWGNAMSCLIGGGGLKGGQVVGSTDRLGERPKDRPLTPWDLHQTIYHVLGVDPKTQFLDRSGRPISAADGGEPIRELL